MDMRPTLFIEALDRLVDLRGLTHRSRTHDTNRNTVNLWKQFCAWLLTEKQIDLVNMPVDGLTLSDLNAFSDYIIQVRKNASLTRNNLIGDLRTLVNSMVSREWLPKNSFPEWTKLVENPFRIHDVYTDDQRTQLIDYLKQQDHRLYYLTQFIYYTFLRPIELTRLRVRDVDLANNCIRVHQADAKGGRKSQGFEVVVINYQFQAIIDKMQLHLAQPNDYLFGKDLLTGSVSILRNRVSERHAEALKKAKLYNGLLTLYGWKHTGVCKAYRAGADIVWLQRQLRHASLDDTQIYLRSLGLLPPSRLSIEW
ncbi:MAG: site-specific integrase [Cytophagaceae bacterium]|nr:MAG: site-specific integrase [Cytophagaceae bacterium]